MIAKRNSTSGLVMVLVAAALAGCNDNEGGGLVARARATIFSIGSSLKDPPTSALAPGTGGTPMR